jgi:hypothetical protein
VSPLQWGLIGVTTAILAAAVSFAALHPDLLLQIYDTSTVSLSSLASSLVRSARELLQL